jgi:hypothetical protein
MWANNLLYMVFIIQVIFISLYMPINIKNKINNVINEHPPEHYPKLYPVSSDAIKMGLSLFWGFNIFIFILGFWIIGYGAYSQSEEMLNLDSSAVLMFFFFLQWLPYLILEITSFKYLKLMRLANTASIRKANLKPRSLLGYFSLIDKILLIISHGIFIIVIEYFNRHSFEGYGGYENLFVLVFIDIFMLSIFVWNVYGKNKNPHASAEDKNSHIESMVKIMVKTISLAVLFASAQLFISATDSRYLLDLFLTIIKPS